MSETAAIIGKGTSLAYAATQGATGTNRTSLGELTDVKMPEASVGKAEATHYESASETKEFIPIPWKEYSDVDFELNYVKTMHSTLNGLVAQKKWFTVTYPDGASHEFPGFIAKLGGESPNQAKMTSKGTMTITGPVTFTAS